MSPRLHSLFAVDLILPLTLLACGPDHPAVPDPPASPAEAILAKVPAADKDLVVYSQNVYVGTDVDAMLGATPEQIPTVLPAVLDGLLSTNWAERADAMAAEIGRAAPDLVALNEITTLRVSGLGAPFEDFRLEFLPVLQAALTARGLNYVVAGSIMDTDANLSLGGPAIRFQDFDVVLVRWDLAISDVHSANYAARYPVNFGPAGSFEVKRGWVAVTISTGQRSVRFVTTHFEPRETAVELQEAQASELLGILDQGSDPVILAGDLNSDPKEAMATTPYHQLLAAGFQDAWLERNGPRTGTGFTCCQNLALRNPASLLFKQIDHVMVRPDRLGKSTTLHPLAVTIFGDELNERTVSGMWPSDHAGMVVTMRWSQVDAVPGN